MMIVVVNSNIFGKNLRYLREEQKMILSEAARVLEISEEILLEIEAGELLDVSAKVMQTASRFFQIPLEELVDKQLYTW